MSFIKTILKKMALGCCRLLNGTSCFIQRHLLRRTLEQIRYDQHKNLPVDQMDERLLGQFIRLMGHKLEKAVRNEYQKGRGAEVYASLTRALAEWEKREYPDSPFIKWAKDNMENYDRWNETRKPQFIPFPSPDLPKIGKDPGFSEVIFNRVSTRLWENRTVEMEKLHQVIKAATYAPTSCNRQTWKLYIYRKDNLVPGEVKTGADNPTLREKAPVVIHIAVDERLYPEKYAAAVDAGIVGLQMSLTASSLGLGNCLMYGCENISQKEIKDRFQIPDFENIYLILLFGYPAEVTVRDKRVAIEAVSQINVTR